MQYRAIFSSVKIKKKSDFFIFLIFAQNIDCGYKLEPQRRGNQYFGAKIGKTGIPMHTPVLLYKSGI